MLLTLQQLLGIISARAVSGSIEGPDAPVSFVVEFDPSRLTGEDVVATTVKALEENPDPRYRGLALDVVWMPAFGDRREVPDEAQRRLPEQVNLGRDQDRDEGTTLRADSS